MTEKTAPAKADDKDPKKAVGAPEAASDAPAKRVAGDATPERPAADPERLEGVDAAVAPYPLYEEEDLDALRALAAKRDIPGILPDVEKALLIKALRDKDRADGPKGAVGPAVDNVGDGDNPYPSYDMMPLEFLRDLAESRDVGLDPEDEHGHLVGQLRASDSGAI